jgi:DNA polymerase-3 subunit delta
LFEGFFDDPMGDALIVVEAADLARRSKLVGVFEAAAGAVAIACYPDAGAQLERLIRAVMKEHGLEISGDAVAYLLDHLGADRLVSRSELEKLALYCRSVGRVELADAVAEVGDSAGLSLDDIAVAVIEGDIEALARAMTQLKSAGMPAITALRAVARHLQRLQLVTAAVAAGENPASAVRALRPPVYFGAAASLERQGRRWSLASVAQSLDRLTQAEAQCKTTGTPSEAVAGQALFALAYRSQRTT